MKYYEFILEKRLKYNLTGKFQAPSSNWIHFTRYMEDYELIVVTQGVAYIQLEQSRFEVKKGQFLLCAPGVIQSGYKKSDCAFYWMHFTSQNQVGVQRDESIYKKEEMDTIYIPEYGNIENPQKLVVMMKQLQDNVRSYYNSLHNDYVCTTILSEIYSQNRAKENQENTDLKKKQLFYDIKDYIKWNLNQDIKVEEIAEHFGYNRRYLSYLFQSIAGVTLKQYMMQERIELAKFLLCDTNIYINEVAYQSGFQDVHNFMKVFKKSVGLTPTQYRNTYAKRLLFYK